MVRLQYYAEICYLVVGFLALRDIAYLVRHPREIHNVVTARSLAFGLLMVVAAPVTLAVLSYQFLRDN